MFNQQNKISISKKSFLGLIFFSSLVLFLVYVRYLILTLIIAFILASFTKYFAHIVQDKYKIAYKYGLIFIFIILLILFISSFVLLLPLLVKESYALIEIINILLKQIESSLIFTGLPIENLKLSQFTNLIPNLGQLTLSILSILREILTYTFLIFILSFYIAINDNGLQAFVKLFFPMELKDKIPDKIQKLQYHIGKWAFIEASFALTMVIFIYTILSILDFQYVVVLSILAGISQLMPILGPALIYLIIILIAFVESPILGLITLTLIITIQLIKQFLLLPIIFKSLKTINPLLVVFALMIGGVLAGALGVIIAMPVVSLARIVYKDINFL